MSERAGTDAVPDAAETVTASPFRYRRTEPSRFVDGLEVSLDDGVRCPRCRADLGAMGHGDQRECSACSLHVALYGNALKLWEDTP